ncbi:hypothetical protein EUGRSUZ_B00697 [Eucalyptus grandis]|uniref:Uncharacterized protein n=2 Tax=Eucalyptus grandis TaxID=71139 RepID=A0ACC3LNC8_EUCGR|nr:hypothetical protein EUGRSUZ_B00697 [Eucalyptus grandis]
MGIGLRLFSWVTSLWLSCRTQFTFQLVQHPHILGAFLESHMDPHPCYSLSSCCFFLLGFSHQQFELFGRSLLSLSLSLCLPYMLWTVEFSSQMRHLLQSL